MGAISFAGVVAFQPLPELFQGNGRRGDLLRREPLCKGLRPGPLPLHRGGIGRRSARCHDDVLGPLMIGIGGEAQQAVTFHVVRKPLHGLARQSHAARDLSNREGHRRGRDGAQNLPARAGEIEALDKGIARGQQPAIQAEGFKDECGDRGSLLHDNTLSLRQCVVNNGRSERKRD